MTIKELWRLDDGGAIKGDDNLLERCHCLYCGGAKIGSERNKAVTAWRKGHEHRD